MGSITKQLLRFAKKQAEIRWRETSIEYREHHKRLKGIRKPEKFELWLDQSEYKEFIKRIGIIQAYIDRDRTKLTAQEQEYILDQIKEIIRICTEECQDSNIQGQEQTNDFIINSLKKYAATITIERPDTLETVFFVERVKQEILFRQGDFDSIIELDSSKNPKPIKPKIKGETLPGNFDELFVHSNLIQDCIDTLKNVNPPILNEDEKYIGKSKGAFCIWIDKLKRRNLVHHHSDRSIYANLISARFAPFSIDESMFGKFHMKAEKTYSLQFDALLSQISQKIKSGK